MLFKRIFLLLVLFGFCSSVQAATPIDEWNFEFKENLLWIDVRVENKSFKFILDSGCTDYVLDSEAAKQLNVNLTEPNHRVRRADQVEKQGLTPPLDLKADDVNIQGVKFLVLPLNESTPDKQRIDGIIGTPLFEEFIVQIDYKKSKIRLFSKSSPPTLEDAIEVDLHPNNALVGVKLADHLGGSGKFIVDTGSSHGVIISPHATEKFVAGKEGSPRTLHAGGKIEAWCCCGTSWKIGSFSVSELETFYCRPPTNGLLSSPQWSGIVGNGFLSKFKVTFDCSGRRIFFQPT